MKLRTSISHGFATEKSSKMGSKADEPNMSETFQRRYIYIYIKKKGETKSRSLQNLKVTSEQEAHATNIPAERLLLASTAELYREKEV